MRDTQNAGAYAPHTSLALSVPQPESRLAPLAPGELMRTAVEVAAVAKALVMAASIEIDGRRYVKAAGWTAVASFHGYLASSDDPEATATGWRCRGYLRRLSDLAIVSEAWGHVGKDEARWAKRPEYAQKGMAQTRAVARVCKMCFSYLLQLMDPSLQETPAEEMDADDGGDGFGRSIPARPYAPRPPAPGSRDRRSDAEMPKRRPVRRPPEPPPVPANQPPEAPDHAPETGPVFWRGPLERVEEKTYLKPEGGGAGTYFALHLAGDRTATTFDGNLAAAAGDAVGQPVTLRVTAGRKPGVWIAAELSPFAAEGPDGADEPDADALP